MFSVLLVLPLLPAQSARHDYKVDAQVMVLAIPVVSMSGVGNGYASIERAGDKVSLRFGAGSQPSRARGFNRLGLIEEIVNGNGASYFGFMTASREESLAEARHSIEKGSGETAPYTAISGSLTAAGMTAKRIEIDLPSRYTWLDALRLTTQIRAAIETKGTAVAVHVPKDHPPATFLHSVHKALMNPATKLTQPFVYNGKAYRLHTEKESDAEMGRKLALRRVARNGESVWRLTGEVENLSKGTRTPFKLWYEPGRDERLPLRIEYRARAFLRLTFELEPPAADR